MNRRRSRTRSGRPRVSVLLLASLLTGPLAAQEHEQVLADRAALLDGVESVAKVGVPGPVRVFGPQAFAVLTGRAGGRTAALVGAARHERGRAVAIGHSGYLRAAALRDPGAARLLWNACRWAAGGVARPRVGLLAPAPGLQAFLEAKGAWVRVLGPELARLDEAQLLIWRPARGELPLARLRDFVAQGGGLISAVCPWGEQQIRGPHGFLLRRDLAQNQLLATLGLVYGEGYLEGSGPRGFAVSASHPDAVHAGGALAHLSRSDTTLAQRAAAARGVEEALRALPADDPHFLPQVRAQVGPLRTPPTPERPLRDPLQRLAALLQFHAGRDLAADDVQPAPGVAAFPGAVPPDAPRVTRDRRFAGAARGWRSTGLYAPPGEVVLLRRGGGSEHWTVRVGCHTDRLWDQGTWKRWPEVSRTWTLGPGELRLASPFGGLIYLEPAHPGAPPLEVQVAGAVEAPSFRLGDPPGTWSERRQAPAPWGELVGEHLILTLPASSLRTLEQPEPLLRWWERVLACYAELGQRPLPARPERFVPDVQISAGYMHSGYPIMTHLDVATPQGEALPLVLDLTRLRREGSWGHFHELGHNHQVRDWTFAGTGEVTCNLFTLYVMDTVVGIEPWSHPWLAPHIPKATAHLAAGAPFATWQGDPGLALVSYAQVQRAFGWAPFQRVFREYAGLPADERPRDDAARRDQWLVRLSRAVGRDLGPFFTRWGIPVSAEARRAVAELEDWLPD